MRKKHNGATAHILGRKISYNEFNAAKNQIKVMYERNHTKFSRLDNNREIDKRHVASLVVSIKKYGQMMPIIVNEKLEVIEGQHRLEACRELNVPVAYIINIKSSSKDIAIINNTQKGWSNKDFLWHFSHQSHSNHAVYRRIDKFFKNYPINFSIGLMLLAGKQSHQDSNNRGAMKPFREGTFVIDDYDFAENKASQLLKLKGIVPHLVQITKFCVAFLRVSENTTNFSIKTCYTQMEKYHSRMGHPANHEEWIDAFCRAYSHKLPKTKHISPRKSGF